MSFDTQEYRAVASVLPGHLVPFLEGSGYFKDQSVKAVEPLFGPGGIERATDAYTGSSAFVLSCKGKSLTDAQKRGVLNVFRTVIQTGDLPVTPSTSTPSPAAVPSGAGPGSSPGRAPTSGGSSRSSWSRRKTTGSSMYVPSVAPASGFQRLIDGTQLKVSADGREGKDYPCTECQKSGVEVILPGITAMYLHHINQHPKGGWAWPKLNAIHGADAFEKDLNGKWVTKGSFLAPPAAPSPFGAPSGPVVSLAPPVPPGHPATWGASPTAPPAAPPAPPMFTPKFGLDVSELFDGRFAVDLDGKTIYVIKRTLKREYTRNGRYVWGKTTRRLERIPAGTIELREQSGDTKELIGEQRKGTSVYYGEQEEAVKLILEDPAAAAQHYGRKMNKCAYCGRSLTDPESQARGIGPDCWEDHHLPILLRKKAAVLKAAGMTP